MATVPLSEQQEQTRALPGTRQESIASPALFGASAQNQVELGRAALNAGNEMARVANVMQDRENADMLFRAETAIKTDYLGFEQQARERRGQDAWGLAKDTADWWEKKGQEHSQGLANDKQREVFGQQVGRLRLQSMDGMSAYESGERRRSLDESAQASIVGSVNLAASQVNTPTEKEAIAGAKDDILKRVAVQSRLNGWSPELATVKQSEALTNLHLQVIQNKVDKDPSGAKQYFELNKAEINGTKYESIERVLGAGNLKMVAQTFADEVQQQGLSEADALKVAREKYSGDEEAAAVQEVKARFQETSVARERTQRTAADTAWGVFAKTGRVSAIPANVLAEMDGRDLVAIRRSAESAVSSGDKLPKTDWDRYYQLRQAALENPRAFASYDLRREFPSLGKAEREGLIDLQGKAQKPDDLKDVATLETQLGNMHDTLGFRANDREKKGLFDRVVTNAISAEQQRTGKKLGYEERQKLMDRMIVEGRIEGSGFFSDTKGRAYEFQGKDEAKRFVPTIPKDERTQITEALKRAGRPVTDDAVMLLYKRKNGL